MKVYVTKYALTLGIQEREVVECGHGMVKDMDTAFVAQYYHIEGKGWHRTIESAIKHAHVMRDNRIKALEKQIDKLKKLKFE